MLLIECPWCGPRTQTEFSYGGDAHRSRPPDPASIPLADWLDFVYLRDNPRGPHLEWWQHTAGCRRWLKVRRNTLTHDVLASAAPHADFAGAE